MFLYLRNTFFYCVHKTNERNDFLNTQNESFYIKASEVATVLDVSIQYAYRIIKQLNDELKQKGALVINGRTNREYFYHRLNGHAA